MHSVLQIPLDHIKALVELIYPRMCVGCNNHLLKEEISFCGICKTGLPFTNQGLTDNPLSDRLIALTGFGGVFTLCYYNKGGILQNMMHALKYRKRSDVGVELGQLLGRQLKQTELPAEIDLILPLPLHKRRMKQRGYNQAAKLAEGVSNVLQIPVDEKLLIRNRYTESQTNKNRDQRLKNVTGAFTVTNPLALSGKRVLLIDDVITTGATILSGTESLQAAGVEQVYVAAVAKADDL